MAEDPAAQGGEGDKKIVHTYPLVKVIYRSIHAKEKSKSKNEKKKSEATEKTTNLI